MSIRAQWHEKEWHLPPGCTVLVPSSLIVDEGVVIADRPCRWHGDELRTYKCRGKEKPFRARIRQLEDREMQINHRDQKVHKTTRDSQRSARRRNPMRQEFLWVILNAKESMVILARIKNVMTLTFTEYLNWEAGPVTPGEKVIGSDLRDLDFHQKRYQIMAIL